MEGKELTKDYLRRDLEVAIQNARIIPSSCTMSTIRWLQRYSHCYSIICSFICLPFWLFILPIAFVLDIFIYTITSIIFVILFVIYILLAPCMLAYKFSSCSDAWNPANIYRHSLREALSCWDQILNAFYIPWLLYCGSGEIEDGVPIICTFSCCEECGNACSEATGIEIRNRPCTIL